MSGDAAPAAEPSGVPVVPPLPPAAEVIGRRWYAHSEEGRSGSRAQHSVCSGTGPDRGDEDDHACVAMAYGCDEAGAQAVAERIAIDHNARVAAEREADGLRRDLAAVGAARDEARRRAREAAQTIIAAIGADGPQNVDEAAARIVARLEAAEAERDLYRAALAAAARGELPRCESCGDRLATMETADGSAVPTCDPCFADDVAEWGADRAQWRDLPHAAALRAAMGGGA